MQTSTDFHLAGKKLMIGLPAYDHKVTVSMAVSLMKLSQMVMRHGIDIQVNSICGCSVVSRARNVIAKQFLESDCDHLMFIDADMTFEPESVIRLMGWNQTRGVVAGAYLARKEPKTYILSLDGGDGINGSRGKVTMDKDGLVRAYRVATGFMMIQKQVFTKLAELHPEWKHMDNGSPQMLYSFFDFLVTPEGMIGEDFLFCDRAREAGFEVWVDPTIKLGHMGVIEHKSDFGEDVLYPSMIKNQTMSDAA